MSCNAAKRRKLKRLYLEQHRCCRRRRIVMLSSGSSQCVAPLDHLRGPGDREADNPTVAAHRACTNARHHDAAPPQKVMDHMAACERQILAKIEAAARLACERELMGRAHPPAGARLPVPGVLTRRGAEGATPHGQVFA